MNKIKVVMHVKGIIAITTHRTRPEPGTGLRGTVRGFVISVLDKYAMSVSWGRSGR